MGWGNFAEKLNRIVGGYGSDGEEKKELSEEAVPEMKIESIAPQQKQVEGALPQNDRATGHSLKGLYGSANSIYDAPAITRDSMPVTNASLSTPKPRKARTPKKKLPEKEQVNAVAT